MPSYPWILANSLYSLFRRQSHTNSSCSCMVSVKASEHLRLVPDWRLLCTLPWFCKSDPCHLFSTYTACLQDHHMPAVHAVAGQYKFKAPVYIYFICITVIWLEINLGILFLLTCVYKYKKICGKCLRK